MATAADKLGYAAEVRRTFEKTSKAAYTHGLEEIYAIEAVDLKSVRPIQKPSPLLPTKAASDREKRPFHQYELPLGERYQTTRPSFILKEPVSVLGLSTLAYKQLTRNGAVRIGELIEGDALFAGLGQGHIDEVREKLRHYLAGREVEATITVDFAPWLRGLFAECGQKQAALLLERYGLGEMIALSRPEMIAITQLSDEEKAEIEGQVLQLLKQERGAFLDDLRRTIDCFVVPWVRGRLGLVTDYELEERLCRIAEEPAYAAPAWRFFQAIYFGEETIWEKMLQPLEPHVFCVDSDVCAAYRLVLEEAKSYFYRPDISYPLTQLLFFLERELTKRSIGFPEGFLQKVLRLSPAFRVRKREDQQLYIRLA